MKVGIAQIKVNVDDDTMIDPRKYFRCSNNTCTDLGLPCVHVIALAIFGLNLDILPQDLALRHLVAYATGKLDRYMGLKYYGMECRLANVEGNYFQHLPPLTTASDALECVVNAGKNILPAVSDSDEVEVDVTLDDSPPDDFDFAPDLQDRCEQAIEDEDETGSESDENEILSKRSRIESTFETYSKAFTDLRLDPAEERAFIDFVDQELSREYARYISEPRRRSITVGYKDEDPVPNQRRKRQRGDRA